MVHATNKRTHSLAKQVGVPNIVALNKEDQVDDKELRR
jgi:translation elongation factor EF-Tu-like GTPase